MRRLVGTVVLVAALGALSWVAIPVVLVQPFHAQTHAGLELAFRLRRAAPIVTLALVLAVLAGAGLLARGAGRWHRVALAAAVLVTLLAAWFARQNHFEWMFHPLREPRFVPAAQADFLAQDDMVLAVLVNGEAVALPVRQLAYNHVVQDTVGGVPIVATY